MTTGLADRIRARAREIGFEEVGFSRAGPAPRAESFRRWLDRGFAGTMEYLARDPEGRSDVTRRSPWARTVVSAAVGYAPSGEAIRPIGGESGCGIAGLVARYA